MQKETDEQELRERLSLIESMIAEGRRTTESWGWTFVLWGVAYYVAIVWSIWDHTGLAWPVTMVAACVVMGVTLSARKGSSGQPGTTVGRAIGGAWIAMGISTFTLLLCLGLSGKYEFHVYAAIIGAMLGNANATSALILKWKAQFACALVWWATSVLACFGTARQGEIGFLTAIFLCQIVFGVYCMMAESRERKRGAVHA